LEIEENISDLKKENLKINNTFTKSLEDPRIKQKAKERLKEFDTEELKQNQPNKTNTKIKNANNFKLKETKKTPELDENSSIKPLVDPEILQIFQKHGYDLTGRNMQPKHKLYYDLNQPLENLLKLCKKSTRYNISFAKRNGVKVDEFLPDHKLIKLKIQKFYKLLLETQKRAKGYPIRSIETFFNLFKVFRNDDNLSLFEASYNQEAIAINISQRTKHWSSSFYAASNRKYPKLKAPYLLRWESITKAKEYGSSLYDFWGIVPNSENHKGYSNHKLSFGGIRVDNYGILAFPISPIKYSIWDAGIWLRTEGLKKLREIVWKIRKKFVK
jgi:lipid II:glycine glycyltransferase (peptidoglycan interpeptide bridge formation enzyme)